MVYRPLAAEYPMFWLIDVTVCCWYKKVVFHHYSLHQTATLQPFGSTYLPINQSEEQRIPR
jgi:hypothetical protein